MSDVVIKYYSAWSLILKHLSVGRPGSGGGDDPTSAGAYNYTPPGRSREPR